MQQYILARGQGGRSEHEAAYGQSDHPRQHSHTEHIPAQSIEIANSTGDSEAGDITCQRIKYIHKQVVNEPPGDQAVKQAGPKTIAKNGLECNGLNQDTEQALSGDAPIYLPLPTTQDTDDAIGRAVSRIERSNDSQDEQDFFR